MEQPGFDPDRGANERRKYTRHRVLKGGHLSFNRGYGALECVVRNRSVGGARLVLGDTAAVPAIFELRINGEDKASCATVRWRTMTDIGVALDELSSDGGIERPD